MARSFRFADYVGAHNLHLFKNLPRTYSVQKVERHSDREILILLCHTSGKRVSVFINPPGFINSFMIDESGKPTKYIQKKNVINTDDLMSDLKDFLEAIGCTDVTVC